LITKTILGTLQHRYERLLHDCMMGEATLFQRADQVEAAWAVVAPGAGRLEG